MPIIADVGDVMKVVEVILPEPDDVGFRHEVLGAGTVPFDPGLKADLAPGGFQDAPRWRPGDKPLPAAGDELAEYHPGFSGVLVEPMEGFGNEEQVGRMFPESRRDLLQGFQVDPGIMLRREENNRGPDPQRILDRAVQGGVACLDRIAQKTIGVDVEPEHV